MGRTFRYLFFPSFAPDFSFLRCYESLRRNLLCSSRFRAEGGAYGGAHEGEGGHVVGLVVFVESSEGEPWSPEGGRGGEALDLVEDTLAEVLRRIEVALRKQLTDAVDAEFFVRAGFCLDDSLGDDEHGRTGAQNNGPRLMDDMREEAERDTSGGKFAGTVFVAEERGGVSGVDVAHHADGFVEAGEKGGRIVDARG